MSANLSSFPLFYRRPVTLDSRRDGKARLPVRRGLAFAKATNSVPLVLEEMAEAAHCYPILFTNDAKPLPIALVGMIGDNNLFVEPAADDPAVSVWTEGLYVPGYVRRYPFVLMDTGESNRFTVCIDGDGLEEDPARPGFDLFSAGGEPSAALQNGIEFCRLYHQGYLQTRAWVDALQAADLLVEHQFNISVNDDKPFVFSGFQIIDPEKFNALPDETFLEWRRQGWLAPIYLHQASMVNWRRLINLALQGKGAAVA